METAEQNIRCMITLPEFEGPLDLLLYLIRKEELDIYDIPISYVTRQYIKYLDLMRELDLEIAGEYLYIASVLINIKSRMLLPKPEKDSEYDIDPREELTGLLIEYKQFKNAGEYLRIKLKKEQLHYPMSNSIIPQSNPVTISIPIDIIELMRSAWDMLKSYNRVIEIPPRDEVDIVERMNFIRHRLEAKERINFIELFDRQPINGLTFVGTFFALLELIRKRNIRVRQRNPFGNIWIYRAGTV